MSLGSFLLTEDNLALVSKSSWRAGRREILEQGRRYYGENQSEAEQVASNLEHLGLPADGAALDATLDGVIAHYYEKLFVITKTYEAYRLAVERVEVGLSLAPLFEARRQGKGVFVGQTHFGATYLLGLTLMVHDLDLFMVARFPEPVGGMMMRVGETIARRFGTARARLINMAEADVDVPGEMMRLLIKRQIVSNVFDEHNSLCKRVELLGRPLMGGTGMDLILRNFDDERIAVVTPFIVRTSDETFRLEVDQHHLSRGDIIDSFFRSLEKRVSTHPDQWYFVHEVHENFVADE
jgi:lauroyl/myristoyl acyltransferase